MSNVPSGHCGKKTIETAAQTEVYCFFKKQYMVQDLVQDLSQKFSQKRLHVQCE